MKEYKQDPPIQIETLNTEKQKPSSQIETPNNENQNTTLSNTTRQMLAHENKINEELIKKIITGKKST